MKKRNGIGCYLVWSLFCAVLLQVVGLAQSPEPIDTIRVDSDLVDLKVSVISLNSQSAAEALQQQDFLVLEDGKPQEISFFAAAEAPFDLILLLDLSGSTSNKLKLIRGSAKGFVDATRPTDRVAVVTFTDFPQLVSGFTLDREQLKKTIDHIEKPEGGTNFWDALRYVLERLAPLGQSSRRTAIVVMTDGVDNALPGVAGDGSVTPFTGLLDLIRNSNAIVFPIYLDTEEEEVKRHRVPRSTYAQAREQLAQLAEVCGTTMYRANKLDDLDTVYARVIKDLSTVYSIGYRPSNKTRDGKWRSVAIQLTGRKNLVARTKLGYYAKQMDPR